MLSSLYAYKGSHARTLGFAAGEKFLQIGVSKDVNWVHVISEKGALGYVPKNYVVLEQHPPLQMLEVIDTCIEAIHMAASDRAGNYSRDEQESLQRLVEMRQEWHNKVPPSSHPSKRPAPPPPNRTSSCYSNENLPNGDSPSLPQPPPPALPPSSSSASLSHTAREDSGIELSTSFIGGGNSLAVDEDDEPPPPVRVESLGKSRDVVQKEALNQSSLECIRNAIQLLPKGYYKKLVQDLRSETDIRYSTSQQAVNTLFQSLSETFPFMSPLLEEILQQADEITQLDSKKAQSTIHMESSDGKKLSDIMEKLCECKDDGQQRSWALHEDEVTIKNLLSKLLDVLNNGDIEVCKKILMLDDHLAVLTLVQYYQMETRWSLRKILLEVFGVISQMSKKNITYLSSSVLPLELTRQLLDPETSIEQLKYCSMVLGIVLSMGDTLPFTHFSIMDESFVEVLLNGIESYNQDPETENLAELYLTLILAYNLQFHVTSFEDGRPNLPNQKNQIENIFIKLLSKRKENKHFLEKLLLLFNREEDPVQMFEFEPRPCHSVGCLMKDIYKNPKTAQLFYTNDEKVLCDIILRQLTDLALDDKRRTEYLVILEGVVKYGHWREHQHRRTELTSRLSAIATQSENSIDASLAKYICSFFLDLKT